MITYIAPKYTIQAVQFDGTNSEEIIAFTQGVIYEDYSSDDSGIFWWVRPVSGMLAKEAIEPGSWIVRLPVSNVKTFDYDPHRMGSYTYSVWSEDLFHEHWEQLSEQPK